MGTILVARWVAARPVDGRPGGRGACLEMRWSIRSNSRSGANAGPPRPRLARIEDRIGAGTPAAGPPMPLRRTHRPAARRHLFLVGRVALVLIALGLAAAPSAARGDQLLYDEDGIKVSAGLSAGVGVFGVTNVDFGAGNINTNAPFTGPVPASQRRRDREWLEGFALPTLGGEAPLSDYGTGYALFGLTLQGTRGDGDAVSSLAQQGMRSTTSGHPTWVDLEDAVAGWRSAKMFEDTLGADALDLSYGNQAFLIGDGLVINSGVFNAFRRGAYYASPATAYERTAILKLNTAPVRSNVFRLETRSDQDLLQGFDQPMSKLAGFNAEWFQSGETKNGVETTPDLWSLGVLYFRIYDADSNPMVGRTGAFSFPPSGPSPSLSTEANRDGLNVFSLRAAGSFFEFDRDILFYGEYVGQKNGEPDRNVDAHAWYVEPGYRFSALPWIPQVNLRYGRFTGDPNPNSRVKRSYDPLFYSTGPRGYGSWYLGEIYGYYLGTPSNIDVGMAKLKLLPLETVEVGAIYYNLRFDQVAQFNDPRITSNHALNEVDLYATWLPTKWLTVSTVLGFAVPGEGFRQAARAFVIDNGPPGRSVGKTMTLGEMIVSVKF